MQTNKIDTTKTYRTKSGYEVRIYATDGGGDYPVHGAFKRDGEWFQGKWTIDGSWFFNEGENHLDLIELKPRIKRTVWIVHHANGNSDLWHSEVAAKRQAEHYNVLAIERHESDVEHGEGLDS